MSVTYDSESSSSYTSFSYTTDIEYDYCTVGGIVELYWLKSVVPEGCKEPEEEQDKDGLTPENQINVKTVQ